MHYRLTVTRLDPPSETELETRRKARDSSYRNIEQSPDWDWVVRRTLECELTPEEFERVKRAIVGGWTAEGPSG
jgi:hypothetical protein